MRIALAATSSFVAMLLLISPLATAQTFSAWSSYTSSNVNAATGSGANSFVPDKANVATGNVSYSHESIVSGPGSGSASYTEQFAFYPSAWSPVSTRSYITTVTWTVNGLYSLGTSGTCTGTGSLTANWGPGLQILDQTTGTFVFATIQTHWIGTQSVSTCPGTTRSGTITGSMVWAWSATLTAGNVYVFYGYWVTSTGAAYSGAAPPFIAGSCLDFDFTASSCNHGGTGSGGAVLQTIVVT